MKNVVHDLSELRKILQRFETGKNLPFACTHSVTYAQYVSKQNLTKCFMNASVSLKLTFTEAVQKFSQMLFTHVKPVKINVYCLLTNEFNLKLRLYDACSTKPTVLDCTCSVPSLNKIKKGQTKQKPKTKPKRDILA